MGKMSEFVIYNRRGKIFFRDELRFVTGEHIYDTEEQTKACAKQPLGCQEVIMISTYPCFQVTKGQNRSGVDASNRIWVAGVSVILPL